MERISIAERPDWKATAAQLGFGFHTFDDEPYWDESAYYRFTLKQIEEDLEEPTRQIHELCMALVDQVVESEELLNRLAIPERFYELIRRSWKEGHPHLYGRMDFSYDGKGPAKLLELNYDTPTSLYETGHFQWVWLQEQILRGELPVHADQFNSVEEKLRQTFEATSFETPFYFASVKGSTEDRGTTDYLRDIASQAQIATRHIDIEDIGLSADGQFVDLEDARIPTLFKLYAWEFLFQEEFGTAIPSSSTLFVEPAWKSILSNKGIMPLLWELHTGHPNLLPSFLDKDPSQSLRKGWVRKPYFSREGANVEICSATGETLKVDGPYTDAPYILQEFSPLPQFANSHTLIGSWVIGDLPAGIGIREDGLITKDSSRFLPHVILD